MLVLCFAAVFLEPWILSLQVSFYCTPRNSNEKVISDALASICYFFSFSIIKSVYKDFFVSDDKWSTCSWFYFLYGVF